MDSKGNILNAELVRALQEKADAGDKKAAKKVAELIPLSDNEAAYLKTMNRAQRRAWYSNKRRTRKRFGGAGPMERG